MFFLQRSCLRDISTFILRKLRTLKKSVRIDECIRITTRNNPRTAATWLIFKRSFYVTKTNREDTWKSKTFSLLHESTRDRKSETQKQKVNLQEDTRSQR